MSTHVPDATVAVVGPGELGARVAVALAASRSVGRLLVAGRDTERSEALASQLRLHADLLAGPHAIEAVRIDLQRPEGAAALLRAEPDVILCTATLHTWRKPIANRALDALPYGVWLPAQLPLVRNLMEAHRSSGSHARVVCLPFPDGVGPALAPLGLAPHIGAGNVTEVASKLRVLAHGNVDSVRLVMHHAAERIAFAEFAPLGRGAGDAFPPPWLAEVIVDGAPLDDDDVGRLFAQPYPLAEGTDTHDLTAAATMHLLEALLSQQPVQTNAPAPGGLSGGYPVRVSRESIELDLPAGITRQNAIAVNEQAARHDGIARIEDDGTIVFTDPVADGLGAALGTRVDRVPASDVDAVAADLLQARDRPTPSQTGGTAR